MKRFLFIILLLITVIGLSSCDNPSSDKPHEHTEVVLSAVPATCTETGLTEGKKCSSCNEIIVAQEIIEKLPHTEETIPTVTASCTTDGLTEGKKCSVCNEILVAQEIIEKLPHTEETIPTVTASCTTDGLTEGKKCSVCNEILVAQEVIKASHAWNAGTITTAPTCTEKGVKTFECDNCDAIKTEDVNANGHIYATEWMVDLAPSCTTEGSNSRHCTVCDDKTDITVVDANGHKWNAGTITTAPTCTEKGVKTFECDNCDESKIEEVAANGHAYAIDTITPTCVAKGKNTYLCSACNDYYEKEWDTLQLNVTLSNNGTIYNGVYSYFAQLKITITGGCNADAPISGVFSVMLLDDNLNMSYIESPFYMENYNGAYSYSKTLWIPYGQYFCIVTNFDTTNGEGVQCYVENWSYRYVVKEISHKYVDNTILPTKTEQGYTEHTCSVCGDYYVDNEVPATGSIGLTYSVNSDGKTCTITGIGTCTDTEILIPTVIDGYTVTAIGEKAFDHCENVTDIVISETVRTIGFRAFQYCTSLTQFTLPQNIRSMEKQIFMECSSLTTVYYNTSAYILEGDTVLKTPYIKKVIFGDNLTTIPSYVCYGCKTIEEIIIPTGVKSIGNYSFYQCTSLKEINLPEGLTYTGFYGFYSSGLTKIILPSTVTSVDESFRDCDYLEYVVIPIGLTAIEGQAFYGCGSFKTFYMGTETEWQYVNIDSQSSSVNRDVYFYSEEIHPDATNEWHFDENGNPVINHLISES